MSKADVVDRPFSKTNAADLIELVDRMQAHIRQSRDQGIGDQSIAFGLMKLFGGEFMGLHHMHIAVPRRFLPDEKDEPHRYTCTECEFSTNLIDKVDDHERTHGHRVSGYLETASGTAAAP